MKRYDQPYTAVAGVSMATDRFRRPLTNLRISTTQRCNLNCIYCHKEGEDEPSSSEMTPSEIGKIVEVAASFGVRKVKLTGGEPLIKSDLIEIVSRIKKVPGIEEISMATNAVLLADLSADLKQAGLSRVNANVPSLNPEVYRKITGRDSLGRALEGLDEAKRIGLNPVKLNMVVLHSINYREIWDMVKYASAKEFIVQLIELENLGNAKVFYDKYYVGLEKVEEKLRCRAEKTEVRSLHNRVVYHLRDGNGKVELVKPFHNTDFCMNCTRMRVTASGKLKPCLMRTDNHIDILSLIRSGASDEKLRETFGRVLLLREPFFLKRIEK